MSYTYSILTGTKATEGSIRNWVNDSTVPATVVLAEAEAWIYERLRVREMLAQIEFTFDEDASSEALPADFLDPIEFLPHGWGDELPFYHEKTFRPERDDAGALFPGEPSRWTIIGSTAHVDVACDEAFVGMLMYYARPAALASDNLTNFLTIRYPTLLRMACTGFAFGFKKDEARKTADLGIADKLMQSAAMTNDLYRRGQHV